MSKELDEQTMGQLADKDNNVHLVVENPTSDVLVAGHICIRRAPGEIAKAEALRDMANRAIAALTGLGLLIVAAFSVSNARAQESRPTWTPRVATERNWGGLDASQLRAVHNAARKLKSTKVEIFCGGDFCRGLAEDLDEALESAGHDANLEVPMFDLGKGAGISPSNNDTRALAHAIAVATGGRIHLKVLAPRSASGAEVQMADKIVIGLGRKPRETSTPEISAGAVEMQTIGRDKRPKLKSIRAHKPAQKSTPSPKSSEPDLFNILFGWLTSQR